MMPALTNANRAATRAPLIYGLVLAGITLMVGGQSLCFFGPESHARLRDVVCHIIFYSGGTCALVGAIFALACRL
jgi:hypothetical protein